MMDHFIRCASAEDADALIEQFGSSRAMACRVVLAEPVYDMSDPAEPLLIVPGIVADGHHVWIALDGLDETLRDLPDAACRLIADREAAQIGEPFMRYVAPDIDDEILSIARVDPVVAGTRYPFGVV